MKSVREIGDISGKKVLVRVDWNVPLVDGLVRDDLRIKRSLDTVNFLVEKGARVTLMTHLEPEERTVEVLKHFLPTGVEMLENLRQNKGEKDNSEEFAKELASNQDYYVNEAFSASHREHASIVLVPKFLPSFAGLGFINEVENLSKAFSPKHPFLFILGGAKFETKLPLVKKFLNIADGIFIAGLNAKPAFEMGFDKEPKITLPIGDISAPDLTSENLDILNEKIENSEFIVWNGPLGKYEDGLKEGTLRLAQMLGNSGKEVVVGGADTLAAIKELDISDKFTFVSSGGGAMLDFLASGTLPGIEALS
ncbi:MAG TPA: phosphoglycerate kinase [Parcubacteria group bacterium]|nr:phosphoglycerate kinase [Parcubacteria group bacterium]